MTAEPIPSSPELARLNILITIAKDACEGASKQYDNFDKTFSALDTKAQNIATIGGAIIAAVIALSNGVRTLAMTPTSLNHQSILYLLPATLALIAMTGGFWASRVREVAAPFSAEVQISEVEDLAALPVTELSTDNLMAYYQARLETWKTALAGIGEAVSQKASRVLFSQICLLLAFLSMFVMLFSTTIRFTSESNKVPPSSNSGIQNIQTMIIQQAPHDSCCSSYR